MTHKFILQIPSVTLTVCFSLSLLEISKGLFLRSHFWQHKREKWSMQGESRGWESLQGNTLIEGEVLPPLKRAPSLLSPSCLSLHPHTHLPGLLSEICQNTFHTNRYFSAFKASCDLPDKPKQLKFCEISNASLFFFPLQAALNTPFPVLQRT